MLITLSEIKKHLNLDEEFTDDDKYLEFLEGVAVEVVQKDIDVTFDDIVSEEGAIPQPLLHAILLFIGNMYANRESVSYAGAIEIPNSLSYILNMYRNYNNANI